MITRQSISQAACASVKADSCANPQNTAAATDVWDQRNLSKLQNIQAFLRVADTGSLTAAARLQKSTVSSVTKAVARLEEELGLQLLHRSTRRMNLTKAGQIYAERCRTIVAELEDTEAELRAANKIASGIVRLALPPAFARRTLIPALEEFRDLYPDLRLDLSVKQAFHDPLEAGFDLVVKSGKLLDSRLVRRVLVRGPQCTVASKAYLDRHGWPTRPEDLADHASIVGAFGPTWRFQHKKQGQLTVRVDPVLMTDSGDIIREAALEGVGITQATWWLFGQDIDEGRLVRLLPEFEAEAEPISIIFPAHPRTPAKVRIVADFLMKISTDRPNNNGTPHV